MKLTAPIAMPTPNTMPASMRFDWPSPKANIRPPTTMATSARPRAMGPVNAVCNTLHGVVPWVALGVGAGRGQQKGGRKNEDPAMAQKTVGSRGEFPDAVKLHFDLLRNCPSIGMRVHRAGI